ISRTWGEGARYIHDYFKPVLLGEDPRNVERLWAKMDGATIPYLGQERVMVAAIGALDVALWDLLGKSAGLPCWRLLGGYRDWALAYADVPIRNETPEELGEQLAECVADGYRAVKFHILSRDPDHIVAETRAARAALDPQTAIAVARRLEEYDVYWLEEPV